MKKQTGKSWYLSSVPVTVPESPFPNTTAKHKPTRKKKLVERKNNRRNKRTNKQELASTYLLY